MTDTDQKAFDIDPTRDRAIGALLGLAAGDAVGTALEFKAPGTFAPIDDMVGGGPFRLEPGQWTDDTSMALCLAESLIETGGMDLTDQLTRYVRWRDEGHLSSTGRCFDIGGTTTNQLSRFLSTGEPVDTRPDPESAANGSLMRLAPVAIRWWKDPAVAAERSAESSRSTHAADRPVDACRVLGAMIAALIGGAPADEVLSSDFWRFGDLHPEVESVARGSWLDKEPPAIRGTGFCVDALEAAIWAVAGATDFRHAVLRAANLGDDADTTAAIAGQIAGARWGATGIPRDWARRLSLVDEICAMADRLFAVGSGPDWEAASGSDATRPPATDADAPDAGPAWPHDDVIHAWWVEPGRVLAGEYPGHRDPARTAQKLGLLVDAGVRTFIDLTESDEGLSPYAGALSTMGAERGLDLVHRRFPIPDFSTLSDESGYDEIVDAIRSESERGAVYVHCWGGVGRTGTVIGCLLVDAGHDHRSALDQMADLRAGTRKADRPAPENPDQEAVIRRRAETRPTSRG